MQAEVTGPSLGARVTSAIGHPALISIVLAFAVGWAVVSLTGGDAWFAYREMVGGAVTGSGLRNTLSRAVPIIGMALAVSLAFRSGVINLGGEGQMVVGGLAGAVIAIYMPGPGLLVVPTAIVVGGVTGAVWALLPALGQTRLRLPILITSLLLNYLARAVTGYLVRFRLLDDSVTLTSTEQVPPEARMPKLPVFGGVSFSLVLVLILVIVIWVVYGRTVAGYETRMAGLSGPFARYGGIGVERQTVAVMLAAGAIGGAIGTHMIVGDAYRYIDGELVISGLAWTGLLVALLANNHPALILAAGLLFSGLQIGGLAMQRNADVSWRLAQVLQALVIVAVASRITFKWFKRRHGREVSRSEVETSGVGEV